MTEPTAALPDDYPQFLDQLKKQVHRARIRTARVANTELLGLLRELATAEVRVHSDLRTARDA